MSWPKRPSKVPLTETIIEMVVGGLGIAALPKWTVTPQLASGALVGVPLKPPGFRWNWSIALLRENRMPAYVQEFIHILAKLPLHAGLSSRIARPKKASLRKVAA